MKHDVLNIGLVCIDSPDDKKVSSGTLFTITQNLKEIGEIVWIPVRINSIYKVFRTIASGIFKLFNKNISFAHTKLGARLISSGIDTERFNDCDVLVAYWAGSFWGFVDKKGKPSVYLSDATFPAMIDYYPPFCKLPKWNQRQGVALEIKTLNNSDSIVLSSDWCARSAIQDLKQPTDKVYVVEFGANISEKEIKERPIRENNKMLNLLFLGVEWERKGGDIAVETVKWLNANGCPACLHVVGIEELDEDIQKLPYVKYIGFLNKNNPEAYHRLLQEIYMCDLLLLPTKAECSAIAFSEASAYGLPIFTHNTGGISNYIEEGRNGYMLPLGSDGKDFGKMILDCVRNGQIKTMSMSAKEVYREKLNWGVWTEKLRNIIMNLVNG